MQIAHDGDSEIAVGLLQIRQYGARRFRIEARHRLVRQNDLRLLRQRTRDAHALLLSTRELVGPRVRLVVELDATQAFVRNLEIALRKYCSTIAAREPSPGPVSTFFSTVIRGTTL